MNLFLHLAWRNLWRNRRRTLISTASVIFAVFLALVMRSMENGSYDYMIDSTVGMYLGYLQIHGEGYWDKRSLDQSIEMLDSQFESFSTVPQVTHVDPRIESYVLLSRGATTKVAQIVGIDPHREDSMTGLAKRVSAGRYLSPSDSGIMVGAGLAKYLDVRCGDSVVIYGQGYHGVTVAANIPVVGILKFPLPELNNAMAYLPLRYAQQLLGAPGRVTSVAFMISSPGDVESVRSRLKQMAGRHTEVMTWQEMMPGLVQSIQADSAGGILMLLILYIVIGFGIFGTIMMMTNERTREFGVLISVGMKRWKLMTVTVMETILIAGLGAGAGLAAGIPVVWFFHLHPIVLGGDAGAAMLAYGLEPILPFSVAPGIFAAQTIIVFILALASASYPFLVIRKLKPVAALRS